MNSWCSTNPLPGNPRLIIITQDLFFSCLIADYVTGDISTSLALSKLNSGGTFFAGPYLDGSGVSNVTTQIGTHAYLPCKVSKSCQMHVSSFFLFRWVISDRAQFQEKRAQWYDIVEELANLINQCSSKSNLHNMTRIMIGHSKVTHSYLFLPY